MPGISLLPLEKRLCPIGYPWQLRRLQELAGFIFILDQDSHSSSFLRSHAVHVAVRCMLVISSMKQWKGGNYWPALLQTLNHCPCANQDDLKTSWGYDGRDGAAHGYSPAKLLPVSCIVLQRVENLQIHILALDDVLNTHLHKEEVQAKHISWWRTEPYAFSKSSHTTWRSFLYLLVEWIWSQNNVACSIQPQKPGTPAFWQLMPMYLFGSRNLIILLAITEKKITPSSFSSATLWNCPVVDDLGCFQIRMATVLHHSVGTLLSPDHPHHFP